MVLDTRMKAVARFVLTAFALYVAWFLFYEHYLMKQGVFVNNLIFVQTKLSAQILNLFPFKDSFSSNEFFIYCNGKRLLRVGEECSALVLFALFAGFIICYPGNWKAKIWYIPLGILVILVLNIVRITLLSINFKYYHSSFAFNHHVTFTYLVYGVIFLMWVLWVNKFGKARLIADQKE